MGIFLVYKALHDSQLFNKEFYFRLSRKIRPFLAKLGKGKKKKDKEEGGPAVVA
jgi:lipopolysaccharide export system permease protein